MGILSSVFVIVTQVRCGNGRVTGKVNEMLTALLAPSKEKHRTVKSGEVKTRLERFISRKNKSLPGCSLAVFSYLVTSMYSHGSPLINS